MPGRTRCARGTGPFAEPLDELDTPRSWYYALLDYGAYLKKTIPNPSRRSASYSKQSRFEGSRRQKRAHIVRMLLDVRDAAPAGLSLEEVVRGVDRLDTEQGRDPVDRHLVEGILADLVREGFCVEADGRWVIC